MLSFCPLASGSKGNSCYIATDKISILVDAGCSGKEVEDRCSFIGICPSSLSAIVLSHEHIDHISALGRLAFYYNIPVLATPKTMHAVLTYLGKVIPVGKLFVAGTSFILEDLEIMPFSVQHDAIDPVGFRISTNLGSGKSISVGICTDLGVVSATTIHHLQGCRALLVESNHDPEQVKRSSRPITYKRRVLGKLGHLSNDECLNLLKAVAHKELKVIYLGHLSNECNSPSLAISIIKEGLSNTEFCGNICIAPQDRTSALSSWS